MKPIYVLLILSLLLCVISCVRESPPMKLVTEDYPPLTYEVNDTITGFGTQVVRAIQEELNSKDEIILMVWDEAYDIALQEPNVIIFTMERTPERESLFYWVGPLGENKTFFYVKNDSKLKITNMEDAKAVSRIATTTDWFSEQYLKKAGFTNLMSSIKPTDNVKQVMTGKADMSIFTDITVRELIKQAGYKTGDLIPVYQLMKSDFYIGISKKTDQKVVDKWTRAFEKIKKKGILENLQSKWLK